MNSHEKDQVSDVTLFSLQTTTLRPMKNTAFTLLIALIWPFLGHCIDSQETSRHLVSLTNQGLIEYKKNNYGHAMALWRKALHIDPSFTEAKKALQFAEEEFRQKHLLKAPSFMEKILSLSRKKQVFNLLLSLNAFLLFFSLRFTIQFLSKKKKTLLEENSTQPFPFKASICAFLFILSLFTVFFSFREQGKPRATVIAKKVSVLVTAQEDSPTLYELPEGAEVTLGKKKTHWVQVSQTGELTGWVPVKALMQASE